MADIEQQERIKVFVGVDVSKGTNHAVALDLTGKRLLDSALPNDEAKLRALITKIKEHGRVLLVVDQPATIGALPVAVARAEAVTVAYLPGLAIRRIADLHAGEAKTDARDAYINAEAARSMPHTLRSLKLASSRCCAASLTTWPGRSNQQSHPWLADTDPSRARARLGAASGSSLHPRLDRATSIARSTCGA